LCSGRLALGIFFSVSGFVADEVEVKITQAKVLVVDDESAFRRVLRTSLSALGFQVAEASTGEQALRALTTDHFDVVLLDVEMPGMGGIEACRQIHQQSRRPAVLMLTVRDGDTDKARAFEAGADGYITKPVPFRELVARIQAVLEANSSPAL
jgi:two-component system KDP operon response regulator KdpE